MIPCCENCYFRYYCQGTWTGAPCADYEPDYEEDCWYYD